MLKRLITSCLGLGWIPVAPGTWGSIPPAVIFFLLCRSGAGWTVINTVMAGLAVLGAAACVRYANEAISVTCKKDPREVVIDEFAGQAITFIGIAVILQEQALAASVIGFLLFRIFDVLKPWPIRKLEKLPAGWGIMADDLLAGIYAAIVLHVYYQWW